MRFSDYAARLYDRLMGTKIKLTASIGKVSGQLFVLLLHRKVALAYARESFDNRLQMKN
jgi:hypothetical protein